MPAFTFAGVSDETLLADLAALVTVDRQTTAALLAHLAEVDARQLFLPAACPSMFAYCTRVLHLSEDAAFKRIRAARLARRYPQIFDAIADGRLHLSGVVMLVPHVTDDNVDLLLDEAAHRTKAEIEMIVARLAPQPDLPTSITPIEAGGSRGGRAETVEMVPGPVPPPREATRATPLSPERFALRVTIDRETRDKLERAQALMRHRNPSGDLGVVIGRAVDALLVVLEREKFGATSRPRTARPRAKDADPRYVAKEVRRTVHARDGEQCSFVSATGERCTERGFLELDHRTPVALGGQPTADQMRFLCHSHNQYEAERRLGAELMRDKREQARARRARAAASRRAASAAAAAAESARADASPPMHTAAADGLGTDATACPITDATARPITDAARRPGAEAPFDGDVILALRGMGFAAAETRRAMADTTHVPATTFEARLRAALAALTASRGARCSDGPFDLAADRLGTFLACG